MRTFIAATVLVIAAVTASFAQDNSADGERETPLSTCMAIAGTPAPVWTTGPERWIDALPVWKASATTSAETALKPYEVRITFVGHSTYRIEDATGLTIATDYNGYAGFDIVPDVVTMNHAHSTHFTIAPDPRIPHVLRGWGLDGKPARHLLTIGETLIRNVTTDIDNQFAGYEPDGNSIFIFEMGGLCIGHLGHLHHRLTEVHYAKIGRLDVLMIPVDGGYTLNVQEMTAIASRLRASLILPMHWFGTYSLERFLAEARAEFPVEITGDSGLVVSLNTLPAQPTVWVMQPETSGFGFGDD